MYLHRYNLLKQQMKKKGTNSRTLISEVRRQKRGFTVFVIDRAPIHVVNARLRYDSAFWDEDQAREIADEANELVADVDEKLFEKLRIVD